MVGSPRRLLAEPGAQPLGRSSAADGDKSIYKVDVPSQPSPVYLLWPAILIDMAEVLACPTCSKPIYHGAILQQWGYPPRPCCGPPLQCPICDRPLLHYGHPVTRGSPRPCSTCAGMITRAGGREGILRQWALAVARCWPLDYTAAARLPRYAAIAAHLDHAQ